MTCTQCPRQSFAHDPASSMPMCVRHALQLTAGVSWADTLRAHVQQITPTDQELKLYELFQNFMQCFRDPDADTLHKSEHTGGFSPLPSYKHVPGSASVIGQREWLWVTRENADSRIVLMLDWLAKRWISGGVPHTRKQQTFARLLREGKSKLAGALSNNDMAGSKLSVDEDLRAYGLLWVNRIGKLEGFSSPRILQKIRNMLITARIAAGKKPSDAWTPTPDVARELGRQIAVLVRENRNKDAWPEIKQTALTSTETDWFICVPRTE